MVVLGIGKVGCNIASLFKRYKNYKVIELDVGKGLKKQATPEAYEDNVPRFKTKLKFTDEEVWVIVCGANLVSSATLRILEQIKNKKINIAYICPDSLYSTPTELKLDKVICNVLQQYTRSGLFSSMYMFDNKLISEIVGNTSITDYYSKINDAIFNSIHNINYANNADLVFGSRHEPKEISRIRAVSIGYPEKNEEKLYFLLDNPTETCYIYSMSKKELQNSDALTEIRKRVEKDIAEGKKSSFCIFEAAHDTSYFYSIKYSHFIQKENK